MPTIVITGANRGLGLAFAQAYAARGWQVLAAVRGAPGAGLDALREAHAGRVEIMRLDLADFASIDAFGASLAGRAVDVLLSNAALTGGPLGVFGETDYERFEQCLRVNSMAPMRLAERLAESVAASEKKIMFFIGSRLGAHPFFGYAGYVISKTALNQVVKQVSMALRERAVIVAAAHPGWVATDATADHGAAPLTPEMSAAMLIKVIDGLTLEKTGRFFDPDGSELPLVTQQTEPKPYGKPKGARR